MPPGQWQRDATNAGKRRPERRIKAWSMRTGTAARAEPPYMRLVVREPRARDARQWRRTEQRRSQGRRLRRCPGPGAGGPVGAVRLPRRSGARPARTHPLPPAKPVAAVRLRSSVLHRRGRRWWRRCGGACRCVAWPARTRRCWKCTTNGAAPRDVFPGRRAVVECPSADPVPGPGQSVFRYSTSSPFCLAVSCSFCLVL